MQRPAGTGELQVQLAVSGARVEPAAGGALLVLNGSGRKIAYSRLRVSDATGRELPARMEVVQESQQDSVAEPSVARPVEYTLFLELNHQSCLFQQGESASYPGSEAPRGHNPERVASRGRF